MKFNGKLIQSESPRQEIKKEKTANKQSQLKWPVRVITSSELNHSKSKNKPKKYSSNKGILDLI
ncbi:hypothetical protein [Scopulibacillus daqui]|uniref:hypothetical protein n=1 Tax=Scopulibacillus daqui TaxID=1469162 RepID=UPI0019608F50|nr:hypothetical protein [Scopulibacillus daqui]